MWARKNWIYDPGALTHADGGFYLMFLLDLPRYMDWHSGLHR